MNPGDQNIPEWVNREFQRLREGQEKLWEKHDELLKKMQECYVNKHEFAYVKWFFNIISLAILAGVLALLGRVLLWTS